MTELVVGFVFEYIFALLYYHNRPTQNLWSWVVDKITNHADKPSIRIRTIGYLLATLIAVSGLAILISFICAMTGTFEFSNMLVFIIATVVLIAVLKCISFISQKAEQKPYIITRESAKTERIFKDRG